MLRTVLQMNLGVLGHLEAHITITNNIPVELYEFTDRIAFFRDQICMILNHARRGPVFHVVIERILQLVKQGKLLVSAIEGQGSKFEIAHNGVMYPHEF